MPNYSSSYTGAQHDEYVTKQALIDLVYPVGSFYMSSSSTSPATLFGGTWEQIKDTFILAAGDTYSVGGTGGSAMHTHSYEHTHTTPATTTGSHTLTTTEMPKHKHDLYVYNDDFSNGGDGASFANKKTSPGFTYDVALGANKWTYSQLSEVGGGGGHTHPQVAITTDSQSATTTSETSNMPPYLVAYIWKRTA